MSDRRPVRSMNTTGMHPPGPVSEALGRIAFAFNEVQPFLPMYLHLIVSALFPIFTGAHASLSRPSSAAKPAKKTKKETGDEDSEEDEDGSIQKMEGLSPSDAIIFPLLAGSTLAGLYFLIKWMGPDTLNKILGWYFSSLGVFSVAKLVNDGLIVLESFCWPSHYADEGVLWHVKSSERMSVEVGNPGDSAVCSRQSPLPGVLGRIPLPSAALSTLWLLRALPGQKFTVRFHLAKVTTVKANLTARIIFSTLVGLSAVLYSNFVSRAWWLTNLQGFAFSYSALQLMSPTTFATGSLILAALFFYDIYFVFYTPMMVTVASNLDVPIKLLFPRPQEEGQARRLAMLGLGDIVLPGIMIGLALRFDLFMHYLKKQTKPAVPEEDKDQTDVGTDMAKQKIHKEAYRSVTGQWGNRLWTSSWLGRTLIPATPQSPRQTISPKTRTNIINPFPKPYFYASIAGYVCGMCVTLGIMQFFQHAQPALLYLVPGVLSSVWLTALARGELQQMWDFSEASEEDTTDPKEKTASSTTTKDADPKTSNSEPKPKSQSSWWSQSFFSAEKSERNAQRLEKSLAKNFSSVDDVDASAKPSDTGSSNGKDKTPKPTQHAGFFYFSIKPYKASRKPKSETPPPQQEEIKRSRSASESNSDDAVLITEADVAESAAHAPKWRGARVSDDAKGERAEKRLRTK